MGIFSKLFGGSQNHSDVPAATTKISVRPKDSDLGFVRGKHFTEWVEHVKQLKREKKQQEVIDLCSEIMAAAEDENRVDRWGVPPWSYEQVALAARRSDQPTIERDAMERYLAQPGSKNPEYVEKFERALARLDAKEGQ